jgi:hypothetical protein
MVDDIGDWNISAYNRGILGALEARPLGACGAPGTRVEPTPVGKKFSSLT